MGCQGNCTVPTFPKPTKEVMSKIKTLNDKEVDNWMIELYKLKLKLEVE
jgi:hypothetical protein